MHSRPSLRIRDIRMRKRITNGLIPKVRAGVTYVGYVCEKCGKMIVVWRSDKNAAEDKPADTIVLDPEVVAEAA